MTLQIQCPTYYWSMIPIFFELRNLILYSYLSKFLTPLEGWKKFWPPLRGQKVSADPPPHNFLALPKPIFTYVGTYCFLKEWIYVIPFYIFWWTIYCYFAHISCSNQIILLSIQNCPGVNDDSFWKKRRSSGCVTFDF